MKKILLKRKARRALKRGVDAVANVVKITLGFCGRNVAINNGLRVTTTNDGMTGAKAVLDGIDDKFEKVGADLTMEVAEKTNKEAGDASTTSVTLFHAMSKKAFQILNRWRIRRLNVIRLREEIAEATEHVVRELKLMATPIKDKEQIIQVATVSAESRELGEIIAETIEKVGEDGVVTVEESSSFDVTSEVVDGTKFDRGYMSPHMITDKERMEAVVKDAHILFVDQKITTMRSLVPILEQLKNSGQSDLIIVAEDVNEDVLNNLVFNKIQGIFNTVTIKSPGFAEEGTELLEDLAVLTGGTVVKEPLKLEEVTLEHLGRAKRVVVSKEDTTVIGANGKITERLEQLKKQLANSESEYDKDKLKKRIASLNGGIAVIRVGASTDQDMRYKKLKIENAVEATKSAMEEGVVAGGGVALKEVSKYIHLNGVGHRIVLDALSAPHEQILKNAGVRSLEIGDEIVDSLKSVRVAVEKASGQVSILLTIDAVIDNEML